VLISTRSNGSFHIVYGEMETFAIKDYVAAGWQDAARTNGTTLCSAYTDTACSSFFSGGGNNVSVAIDPSSLASEDGYYTFVGGGGDG
jgi:hypothetical protein